MKKLAFIIILVLAACTNNNNSSTYQQEAEKLSELLESYVASYDNSSDIKAVNNEKKGCIEMTWKGKIMTTSYDIYFKDLLSDTPTSYAKDLQISMVLFQKGINSVTDLVFDIEGMTFKVIPFVVTPSDEFTIVGFTYAEESFIEAMSFLSVPHYDVSAWLNTNNGKIVIPEEDITNLQAMVLSYKMNGGSFE